MYGSLAYGDYTDQTSLPDPLNPGYIVATDALAADGITRDAYEPDNLIRLTATIYQLGDILENPATLTLRILAPDAQDIPIIHPITDLAHVDLGLYSLDLLVVTPGQWVYRFASTTPFADTGDQSFWVLPSMFT